MATQSGDGCLQIQGKQTQEYGRKHLWSGNRDEDQLTDSYGSHQHPSQPLGHLFRSVFLQPHISHLHERTGYQGRSTRLGQSGKT
jgi:hypothetical protein